MGFPFFFLSVSKLTSDSPSTDEALTWVWFLDKRHSLLLKHVAGCVNIRNSDANMTCRKTSGYKLAWGHPLTFPLRSSWAETTQLDHFLTKYNYDEVTTSKKLYELELLTESSWFIVAIVVQQTFIWLWTPVTDRQRNKIHYNTHSLWVKWVKCAHRCFSGHRSYWVSSMVARREKVHAVLSLISAGMSDFSS